MKAPSGKQIHRVDFGKGRRIFLLPAGKLEPSLCLKRSFPCTVRDFPGKKAP